MKLRGLVFLLWLAASPLTAAAQDPDAGNSENELRSLQRDINPRPRPPRRPFGGSMEELEKFREKLEEFRGDVEAERRVEGVDRDYREGIREYREGISAYKEAVAERGPD